MKFQKEPIKIHNLQLDQTLQKVPSLQKDQGVRPYPALQVDQRDQSLHGLHEDRPYRRLQRGQEVQQYPERIRARVYMQFVSFFIQKIQMCSCDPVCSAWVCSGNLNSKSILTAGPEAPILPAAPGKPVRPWNTHTATEIMSGHQVCGSG